MKNEMKKGNKMTRVKFEPTTFESTPEYLQSMHEFESSSDHFNFHFILLRYRFQDLPGLYDLWIFIQKTHKLIPIDFSSPASSHV